MQSFTEIVPGELSVGVVWFKLLIFFSYSYTYSYSYEDFWVQLIFGNNCNRYLIQLLLHSKYSKYLIIEQNLAVHFCEHFIVN